MTFWEKIRRDLKKGFKEGLEAVKEGAAVVKGKAEDIAEEGKRRYRIFELKTKVQKEIADLGGRIYDLSPKVKNPMLDNKVKAIMNRIKKVEAQITKLEGKSEKITKKAITRRPVKPKGK